MNQRETAIRMMRRQPLVSVIIPTYNAAAFIRATLESVSAQSHTNFEALVVDDCSTDATTVIVEAREREDGRFRLIRLPRNCGAPAGPRNIGVREAKGEWVAFLDADDIWHPMKLAVQMEALRETGAKFCSTAMTDFSDGADIEFTTPHNPRIQTVTYRALLFRNRIPTSSVAVDTATMRKNPFNEDPLYKAREDYDCWLRCHQTLGKSIKIDHPMVGYRQSPSQISASKLRMMRRHYHVLSRYKLASGRPLGIAAALFTCSHFASALYYRRLLERL